MASKFVFLFFVSFLRACAGQVAPEIFVAPSAMHVDYGATAYMACVAYVGTESQSGVVTQMAWSDPHLRPLFNNSDSSVTIATTRTVQNGQVFLKSILKICNFTTEDFGQYTCRVTNIYGQNQQSWIVSIVQLPIAPVLLTSPTDLTTTVGNTIYMTCSAYGYPYPAIIWRRNGQVVQPDGIVTIDTRVKNYNGALVSVSTLKICGVDADQHGSYTCTASIRDIGQVTSRAWTLTVPQVPIIARAPDTLTINYGVTAYMTCVAYIGTTNQGADQLSSTLSWLGPDTRTIANASDGSVNVYAERDSSNGQVYVKSYLKICNFTQSNAGRYSCQVSNANGQDSKAWDVSLPSAVIVPRLVAVSSNQTAREGNTIYMTCAAYGYPYPDVIWYKNGQVIGADTNGLVTVDTNIVNYDGALVVQSVLRICLLRIEDAGIYSCSASTRDFGVVRSQNIGFNVLPVPTIVVAPESQDVNYGVTAFMSCVAHVGNTAQGADQLSTTLTWWGPNSQQLTNSTADVTVYTETTVAQSGHVLIKSIIQICGFTLPKAGVYSCRVSNANGQDTRNWTNTIPRQPVAPTLVARPAAVTVSEGNSVIMTCAGYGYPYPRITWFRNGLPLDSNSAQAGVTITSRVTSYSGALVSESILKICGAAEDNHGIYSCRASSAFGNPVVSDTWTVTVSPAPTIVVAPQDQQVEIFNTVFMTCAAYVGTQAQNADTLATTFTWWGPNSDQPLAASDQITFSNDNSIQGGRVFVRSILKICGFSESDVGRYTCRASNANGNENRTWTTSFPASPNAPQLLAITSYDDITSGNTVYFGCAVYGYPQPQITWTKDDSALPASASVTAGYATFNNLNVTWSFVRVCGFRSTDSGLYMCSASSALGSLTSFTRVGIAAPEIVASPTSRMATYRHTVYMSCIAYIGRMNRSVDQLQTTFSWWDSSNRQLTNSTDGRVEIYTPGLNIQNGLVFLKSTLKICNFTEMHTGRHMCRVSNSNGQDSASWNLTFLRSPLPPQFLVTPSTTPYSATYSRTVYLFCVAYGFPFPQITWSLNGRTVYPNETMYRVNIDTGIVNYDGASVSQSVLKICGVGEEDMGTYTCTASTSAFGSITTTPVTLSVVPAPTLVVAPANQEATLGKTTLMTCVALVGLTSQNAANIATSISWQNPMSQQLRNNSAVTIYSRTQTRLGMVFVESILKICNFSNVHEGNYSCQVSNVNGLEMNSWSVFLHQASFAPSLVAIPLAQSSRRYGYSVVMECAAYGYPPPIISFTQRGVPIGQAQLDGPYRVKNRVQSYVGGVDVAVGVLQICSFDYDDTGPYTCTASARNVGEISSTPWSISVIPAPFLVASPQSQSVNYDTILRMTCTAALGRPEGQQQPTATITWYDAANMTMDNSSAGVTVYNTLYTNATDGVVYLRSNAVVNDIGLQHLGELSCFANNALGSDVARWNITPSLDYTAPSGVSAPTANQTVSCSDPITVMCRAWGYPPPDITWSLNGTNIDPQNQMDTLGLNYTDSRLMINQFNRVNSGIYVCTASNDVGSAKASPVVLSLDIQPVVQTAAPTITSTTRTSDELAVVNFQPVGSNPGQQYAVTYYIATNSSGAPDLSQLVRVGAVQSTQTQVTLTDLETCNSYWATVAVVNSCGVERSAQSSPMLVGRYDVKDFDLLVTLPASKPCSIWITEDTDTKITDMTKRLQLAASTCGITIPCIVSRQWQCSAEKARFSSQLIGDAQTPSNMITNCINKWITDAGGSMTLQIGNTSYAVGLAPTNEGSARSSVNGTVIGIAVVVVIVVIVAIIVIVIVALVMIKGRSNKKPAGKERLEEQQQDDFNDVYSRHSFAVVENPLFAEQEEGDDAYAGGAEGYEYDSGTLERKEDLGEEEEDVDDKGFI